MGFVHIAAITRVELETQRFETETKPTYPYRALEGKMRAMRARAASQNRKGVVQVSCSFQVGYRQ